MYLFQFTEVVTKMDCMQVGDINVADEARDFVWGWLSIKQHPRTWFYKSNPILSLRSTQVTIVRSTRETGNIIDATAYLHKDD